MNADEHYKKAEELLKTVGEFGPLMAQAAARGTNSSADMAMSNGTLSNVVAAAQVHATLAQVHYLREIGDQLDTLPRRSVARS